MRPHAAAVSAVMCAACLKPVKRPKINTDYKEVITLFHRIGDTMGLDLQPDGLIAGLAGHYQPDKKSREGGDSGKVRACSFFT